MYRYLQAQKHSTVTRRNDFAACDEHNILPCLDVDPEQVEMILEETMRYDTGSKLSNVEWLLTRAPWGHAGYVRIGEDYRAYGIAMVHQLHCVEMFARALPDPEDANASPPHIAHCLQYLKQLFLCNSDTTLEPYNFEDRDFASHPVGMSRTCRNWAAVYAAADENYARWAAQAESIENSSASAASR
ncbi:uncharacterized protein PHACADRAFT_132502 [Phanerochaete carnosa HHB-10118-sp]|uniref:Oxidase ustYa n=1 Tax=Phanerochaete carnosa (strain HHB-10118-sp) TaxID=650164 RepID=K5VNV9_PHACS|nr:uncharacterized protein PHACADRAFT_132502 [Phanerochaete carnosa HHB-10118-sp]EKM48274.1 hypothetical protein PHACADRAFT_132502 [Phanerochaete carnosa HHB-10118-sp]